MLACQILQNKLYFGQGVLTLRSVWVLTPQYNDGDAILSKKALSFG